MSLSDAAAALRAHESQTSDPSSPVLVELTDELAAKLRRLDSLEALDSKVKHSLTEQRRISLVNSFRARCVPFKIGGRDGVSPSEDFDIQITVEPSLDGGPPRQIAWVPVPIWPIPLQSPAPRAFYERRNRDGSIDKIPNFDLGRCTVSESLAEVLIFSNEPLADGTFKQRRVSITGFACISLSSKTVAEVADSVTSRDHALSRVDDPSEPLILDKNDNPTTSDSSPAFIPSLQPTSQPVRPSSHPLD